MKIKLKIGDMVRLIVDADDWPKVWKIADFTEQNGHKMVLLHQPDHWRKPLCWPVERVEPLVPAVDALGRLAEDDE